MSATLKAEAKAGTESLTLNWTISSTEGLGAFLLHWRVKSTPAVSWQTALVPATTRSQLLPGLKPELTEWQVRALDAAQLATGTSTPLAKSEPVESTVPVLSVSGDTISWPPIAGVTEYEFAIILNPSSTRETTYERISSTSVTPPAVPGETVAYGCRVFAPTPSEMWAEEVEITYAPAEEPPIEPPKTTVSNACLPGVCINGGGTFGEAVAVGLKGGVGRVEGNMATLASQAIAAGMQANFLLASGLPTVDTAVEEYLALHPELKPGIRCIGVGNESWAGGIHGTVTGDQYGECFVTAAATAKSKGLPIPLLCQVRIAENVGDEWMTKLVATPGLKAALIGNGTASAPQHILDSHPYYASMMVAPKEPTNLANRLDNSGNAWGGNGWMKEQAYILLKLQILCSIALSEYGARFSGSIGSDDSVGSQAAQAKIGADCMAFMKLVKEGKVPAAWKPLANYTPLVDHVTWFSLFGNAKTSMVETFGLNFYPAEGGKNEPLYAAYKAGALALAAA
jgi:hypothetical protein